MESLSDLKTLATKLNPAVGYWDPLKLGEVRFARVARPRRRRLFFWARGAAPPPPAAEKPKC